MQAGFYTDEIIPGGKCFPPRSVIDGTGGGYAQILQVSPSFLANLFWNINSFNISGSVGLVGKTCYQSCFDFSVNYFGGDLNLQNHPISIVSPSKREVCSLALIEGTGGPFFNPGIRMGISVSYIIKNYGIKTVLGCEVLDTDTIIETEAFFSIFLYGFAAVGAIQPQALPQTSTFQEGDRFFFRALLASEEDGPFFRSAPTQDEFFYAGNLTINTDEGSYFTFINASVPNLCDEEGPNPSVNIILSASRANGNYRAGS